MAEPPKQGEPTIDEVLEDLEIRLERLRSLYEQYFLGLEKIEPAVARKDVDRRIWLLRRTKLRNTAKRFKLQTIIQRYNTFQQYWQRICREIENGTYKRHLLRAQKTVGMAPPMTIAAKKRLGMYARGRPGDESDTQPPPPAAPERSDVASDLFGRNTKGFEEMSSLRKSAQAPPLQAPVPSAPKAARPMEKLELDIDDMFGPAPPRKPVPKAAPIVAKRPAAPPAPANPPAAAVKRAPPPIPARPAPAAPTPPAAGGLSDRRVRELHQRLVDAQRQLANARPVSVEGLAKSLREAETKIRAQHGNRKIDFDIVVKDGKAVVKPILR